MIYQQIHSLQQRQGKMMSYCYTQRGSGIGPIDPTEAETID